MENTATASAHTAAPWMVDRRIHTTFVFAPSAKSIECTIAQVFSPANAPLIAAAPELLEALKDVTQSVEDFYDMDHHAAGDYFGIALLERLRHAIAKAEGI